MPFCIGHSCLAIEDTGCNQTYSIVYVCILEASDYWELSGMLPNKTCALSFSGCLAGAASNTFSMAGTDLCAEARYGIEQWLWWEQLLSGKPCGLTPCTLPQSSSPPPALMLLPSQIYCSLSPEVCISSVFLRTRQGEFLLPSVSCSVSQSFAIFRGGVFNFWLRCVCMDGCNRQVLLGSYMVSTPWRGPRVKAGKNQGAWLEC